MKVSTKILVFRLYVAANNYYYCNIFKYGASAVVDIGQEYNIRHGGDWSDGSEFHIFIAIDDNVDVINYVSN